MKNGYLVLSLLIPLALVGCAKDYDYIPTPEPNQISDLMDDDSDGVINARDICPDTVAGAEIDNDGCGSEVTVTDQQELKILFNVNSYEISPVFQSQISDMATFLQKYPETSIEIKGYASKEGRPEANLILSEKRAKAVEQQLINDGISPDRVKIIGYGASEEAEVGDGATSLAMNRRVVASVVGTDEMTDYEWTIFSKREK